MASSFIVDEDHPITAVDNGNHTYVSIYTVETLKSDLSSLVISVDDGESTVDYQKEYSKSDIQDYLRQNETDVFTATLDLLRPKKYHVVLEEKYINGTEIDLGSAVVTIAGKPNAPVISILDKNKTTVSINDDSSIRLKSEINVQLPTVTGGAPLRQLSLSHRIAHSTEDVAKQVVDLTPAVITSGFYTWVIDIDDLPADKIIRFYASVDNDGLVESKHSNILSIDTSKRPKTPSLSNVLSQKYDKDTGKPIVSMDVVVSGDNWSYLSIVGRAVGQSSWKATNVVNFQRSSIFTGDNAELDELTMNYVVSQLAGSELTPFIGYQFAAIVHTAAFAASDAITTEISDIPHSQSLLSQPAYAVASKGPASSALPLIATTVSNTVTVDDATKNLKIAFEINNPFNVNTSTKALLSLKKNGTKINSVVLSNTSTLSSYSFTVKTGDWATTDKFAVNLEYYEVLSSTVVPYCVTPPSITLAINSTTTSPAILLYSVALLNITPTLTSDMVPTPKNPKMSAVIADGKTGALLINETSESFVVIESVEYQMSDDANFGDAKLFYLNSYKDTTDKIDVINNNPNEYKLLFKYNAQGASASLTSLSAGSTVYGRLRFSTTSNSIKVKSAWVSTSLEIPDVVLPGVEEVSLTQLPSLSNSGQLKIKFENPASIPDGYTVKNYTLTIKNENGTPYTSAIMNYVAPTLNEDEEEVPAPAYNKTISIDNMYIDQEFSVEIFATYLDGDNKLIQGQINSDTLFMNKLQAIGAISFPLKNDNTFRVTAKIDFGRGSNADLQVVAIVPHDEGKISLPLLYKEDKKQWESADAEMVGGIDYSLYNIYIIASSRVGIVAKMHP